MADLSGMSGDEFIEQLKRALGMADAGKTAGIRLDTKDIERFIESFKPLEKRISKAKDEMGGFTKGLLIGRKHIEDFDSEIKHLSKELEQLNETGSETNDAMKRELIQRLEQIKSLQRSIQTVESFRSAVKGIAEVGVQGIKSMGSFAKSVQEGPDVINQMSSLTQGVSDVAGTGLNKVTQGMSAAGSMMANSTNPRIKALGVVAGVAGTALGTLGGAALAAGKFAADFLIKELEKTIVTFQKASAAGAIMTDGMTGLRNAAAESGLTVKQFGQVISNNAPILAQSGLGVGEAAKKIGRIGSIMKQTGMDENLLKLGYGYEEQAELQATTLANMRRTAGGMVSDKDVAAQTAKYAENLRIIASITGEDAKAKVKQVQQQNQILRFQQEMAKMSPKQRAEIDTAMATMTEMEKKAFRERVMGQGVMADQEAAVYESSIAGAREKGEAAYQLFKQNELTAKANSELNVRFGKQIKQSALAQESLSYAAARGVPVLQGVAAAGLEAIDQANTYTTDSVSAATEGVKKQKEANDELTQGFVDASKAAQQMAVDLENIVLKDLGNFSKLMGNIFKELQGALDSARKGLGEKTLMDKTLDLAGNVGMAAMALAGLPGVLSGAKSVLGKMGKGLPGVGTAGQQMELFSEAAGPGAAGKAAGAAGKVNWGMAGKLSIGGILGGLALDAATEKLKETGHEKAAAATDIGSSALSGMGLGATIGSFIPVIGTAVGAGIGGVLGAGYGWYKNRGALSGTATEMAPASTGVAQAQGQLASDQASVAAETKNAIMSVSSANQNIEKTVAELRAAIDTLAKQDPENKIMIKQILSALENVRDTMKDQAVRDEQLIRVIQDHKDVSERLLNNSY